MANPKLGDSDSIKIDSSYNAIVLPVMIASPSDVELERKIIREVLHSWNDINAASKQLVFLPVGWETHTSPELGAPAQDQINKKVLEKCDVLIAAFWNRIGTPTKAEQSGTIEEIKNHYNSGKTTLVYFSNKPVNFDDVDLDQKQKLKEFKQWCRDNGLTEDYESHEDFKRKLERQIQITINESNYILSILNSAAINSKNNNSGVYASVAPSVDSIIMSLQPKSAESLVYASQDKHGVIRKSNFLNDNTITTNFKDFNILNDTRDWEFWCSILERFESQGLVKDMDGKGLNFKITNFGYEVADQLIPG